MQPLVSVIVPVFKVEDCLRHCLDSLRRQSLHNIEIILIDDASPDRCGKICEEYAAKDKRFKTIHHEVNRGLSAARNTGIAYASAEYLMFVDSDDYVHEDFCKIPYECAVQQQADLVLFLYQYVDKNGLKRLVKNAEGLNSGKQTRLKAFELMWNVVRFYAWNKLYARYLFNTISYPEGYFYEDVGTIYKTVLLADTIYFLDKVLYFHCYHDGSIGTLMTEKASRDWFVMSMQRYHDLAVWGYPADRLQHLLTDLTLSYCMRTKANANDDYYVFCRKTLQTYKKIPENFTWKRKVLFVLLRYCPPMFDLVCVLWGKRW